MDESKVDLTKATPRPWTIVFHTAVRKNPIIAAQSDHHQWVAIVGHQQDETKAANAALIVTAVNQHASLTARVAELEGVLRDARDNGLIYWEPNTGRGFLTKGQMLERINAALKGES